MVRAAGEEDNGTMNTHYHELSFCHPNLLQIMGTGMGESVLEYSSGSTPKHRSSELFEGSGRERICQETGADAAAGGDRRGDRFARRRRYAACRKYKIRAEKMRLLKK